MGMALLGFDYKLDGGSTIHLDGFPPDQAARAVGRCSATGE
jgi:hypothetical protein